MAHSAYRSSMIAAKVLHVTHRHKCVVACEVIRFAKGDVVEAAIVLLEFVVDTYSSDAVFCILNEIRYTTWATFTHSVKQTCGNSLRNLGFFLGVFEKKIQFTVRLRLRWWHLGCFRQEKSKLCAEDVSLVSSSFKTVSTRCWRIYVTI